MALYWGVEPIVVSRVSSTDRMLRQARKVCLNHSEGKHGQTVVLVGGAFNESGRTHFMSVHSL
jgi:pyruvate kinase